jgi:DNA-binding NtrC family response regulator
LYGVINILNHASSAVFPEEWKERLSAVGVMYGAALAGAGRLTRVETEKETQSKKKRKRSKSSKSKTIIVGISPTIQEGLGLCLKAANTDIPILILGETGTGKELAAHRIHESSDRARGPFLAINCAAVTETILESELFGHIKGAFTGAGSDRQGKFVAASGGILFLDEIGDMALVSQVKILRALEEKKVTPVGSEKTVDYDARIIAATNHDLTKMVEQGKFRADLYYRLCGIEICLPPLRERVEDIHLLAMHFLNKANTEIMKKKQNREPLRLSKEASEVLLSFDWPGNVRQLEQAVLGAAAICEGSEIKTDDFPGWFRNAVKIERQRHINSPAMASSNYEQTTAITHGPFAGEDRVRYQEVLESTKYPGTGRWNVTAAARDLGIPRKTFTYRLKKLGFIK